MAEPKNVLPPKPDDRLKVKFGEGERVLFMSFARLNNLLRMLDSAENLPALMLNPDLADAALRIMLAEQPDQMLADVPFSETDMEMDEIDKALIWVRDHVTYFFMKRFQQLGEQMGGLEQTAQGLRSSLPGFMTSSSNEVSAGPSA